MCDTTNKSAVQEEMYGQSFAGVFGYSRMSPSPSRIVSKGVFAQARVKNNSFGASYLLSTY